MHIWKYREFTKGIPLKLMWIFGSCFSISLFINGHLFLHDIAKEGEKGLLNKVDSNVEIIHHQQYMDSKEKYDKMRNLILIINEPQKKERGRQR